MEQLILKNVIGSEATATPIPPELICELHSLKVPLGVRIPSNWQPPEDYIFEKTSFKTVPVERLKSKTSTSHKVVILFHGGGYVWALTDTARELALLYSELTHGAEIINIDYRVAPTDVYPAAIDDCINVYKTLLELGYKGEDILLAGESSGGGLILALTLYLKDHNLPLPKALITISPWTEVNNTAPSYTLNHDKDIILGKDGISLAEQLHNPAYRGTTDFKTPYLSPLYGEFSNFPPLLIQVGTHEVLYDDSRRLAEKVESAHNTVVFSSYYGMFHCFQEFAPDLPESQLAWKEIKDFINTYFLSS